MEYQSRVYGVTPGGQPTSGHRPPPTFFGGRPTRRAAANTDAVQSEQDADALYGPVDDGDQGDNGDVDVDQDIDDLGHQPSGARVTFVEDPITGEPRAGDDGTPDEPPAYAIPAGQSATGMHEVPWQSEQQPGDLPRPATTPTSQVKSDGSVEIGVQSSPLPPPD